MQFLFRTIRQMSMHNIEWRRTGFRLLSLTQSECRLGLFELITIQISKPVNYLSDTIEIGPEWWILWNSIHSSPIFDLNYNVLCRVYKQRHTIGKMRARLCAWIEHMQGGQASGKERGRNRILMRREIRSIASFGSSIHCVRMNHLDRRQHLAETVRGYTFETIEKVNYHADGSNKCWIPRFPPKPNAYEKQQGRQE